MKQIELTDKGQITNEDKRLWAITVPNTDDTCSPFLLFAFLDTYPSKEQVKKLMAEQYIDWVDAVDDYGYFAETVYVEGE